MRGEVFVVKVKHTKDVSELKSFYSEKALLAYLGTLEEGKTVEHTIVVVNSDLSVSFGTPEFENGRLRIIIHDGVENPADDDEFS